MSKPFYPNWGFPMHRCINRKACELVPEPLRAFYMQHQTFLEVHATDADSRRYAAADEACRHFIDADFYDNCLPLDSLPLDFDSALSKFGDSAVFKHGIVPYQCVIHLNKLKWAFEHQNTEAILRYSADLGHYAADANVPLHTHSNYNGQFTQQWGIHALWETELPYYFQDSLEKIQSMALVIYNVSEYMHKRIEAAHAWLPVVFQGEREARMQIRTPAQHSFVWQGNNRKKMASWALAEEYSRWVMESLISQFSASIQTVASLWFTAWIVAGEPPLPQDTHGLNWPIPIEQPWNHD